MFCYLRCHLDCKWVRRENSTRHSCATCRQPNCSVVLLSATQHNTTLGLFQKWSVLPDQFYRLTDFADLPFLKYLCFCHEEVSLFVYFECIYCSCFFTWLCCSLKTNLIMLKIYLWTTWIKDLWMCFVTKIQKSSFHCICISHTCAMICSSVKNRRDAYRPVMFVKHAASARVVYSGCD